MYCCLVKIFRKNQRILLPLCENADLKDFIEYNCFYPFSGQ